MKNYKLQLSEGFKDSYGYEMVIKKELENRILSLFGHHGYCHIKTPQLEYIDVYSENGNQKPDLYNLINRQGEVLSLCNDMTSSIARFVGSKKTDDKILKYCYVADTFRYPRLYQGKNHQFLQAGVELIGVDGLYADIECIFLAYKALASCNVENFTIHLGSSEFLNNLFDDFNINEALKANIYALIENKDYLSLKNLLKNNLDKDKADFIIDLFLRGGRLHFIEDLAKALEGTKAYNTICYLKDIYLGLNSLGVNNILFDFSIYSYAKYYTGVIFQIYVDKISKSVVSGGRANNLFKNFGKDLADIGFGLDLDVLTDYIINEDLIDMKQEKYISITLDDNIIDTIKKNDELRKQGIVVYTSYSKDLNEVLEYAKINGYSKVLEYNQNEVTVLEVK